MLLWTDRNFDEIFSNAIRFTSGEDRSISTPEHPRASSSSPASISLPRGPSTLFQQKNHHPWQKSWRQNRVQIVPTSVIFNTASLGPHSWPVLSSFSLQGKLVCSQPWESKGTRAYSRCFKGPKRSGGISFVWPFRPPMPGCSCMLQDRHWPNATGERATLPRWPSPSEQESRSPIFKHFKQSD